MARNSVYHQKEGGRLNVLLFSSVTLYRSAPAPMSHRHTRYGVLALDVTMFFLKALGEGYPRLCVTVSASVLCLCQRVCQ